MEYTTVIIAGASDPLPCSTWPLRRLRHGRVFLYNGQHALIIYDDLTRQAQAYRQLSLSCGAPGTEAYPGDIFYCHSRLLSGPPS